MSARQTQATRDRLDQERQSLPINSFRDEFVQMLNANQCMVLVGETGSGKTTQVPRWCYEYLEKKAAEEGKPLQGMVACTQPRRVAAMSVAHRVADEMGVIPGNKVGYSVRFNECTSEQTVIKYLTDGMLLREITNNKFLTRYGIVVLDEAHERTISCDILMALVKAVVTERPEFKVVIMSATLEARSFQSYFGNCGFMEVPGRMFDVKLMYLSECCDDYVESTVEKVVSIHMEYSGEDGDILVFMPGQEEIEDTCRLIYHRLSGIIPSMRGGELECIPLYSSLPWAQQQRVFEKRPNTPVKLRRCIVATNIAETSVTIDGIVFVIDTGYSKTLYYDPGTKQEVLLQTPISQASAVQRAGRAGRTRDGLCFRLYTENAYDKLKVHTAPEIVHANLANVVLNLKKMGINDLVRFDFLTPPSPQSLVCALDLLMHLEAIDEKGNLTILGRILAEFPLPPQLGKALVIAARKYDCSNEILTLVSMLAVQPCFLRPHDKREQARLAHEKFIHPDGDHLSMINLYQGYKMNPYAYWCNENFVSFRFLKEATDIRGQLSKMMDRMRLPRLSQDRNTPNFSSNIRKAMLEGFSNQVAVYDATYKAYYTLDGQKCAIHGSSTVKKNAPVVMYGELAFTHKCYIRQVSIIDPEWVPNLPKPIAELLVKKPIVLQ